MKHPHATLIFCLTLALGLGLWYGFTNQIKIIFQPRIIEINNNRPAAPAKLAELEPLLQPTKKAANFLLLGAPGVGNDAPDLTDTILLARLDEAQNKIYLFSLPRDLAVKIPDSSSFTKLNALYAFNKNNVGREFDALIQKIQDITGLAIDHYIFVNLQAVKQLVDIFGGVNILVAENISDPTFPGPNHSFEPFTLQAGWRYLDGETALKYMRTRYSAAGDFDRTARQQDVLQALKQKVLALNFWDIGKFLEVYNALASNIKSDLNLWQIKGYWDKIKDIPGKKVVKNELAQQNLLTTRQINWGGELASVAQPKAGLENYEEIKKFISEQINFK